MRAIRAGFGIRVAFALAALVSLVGIRHAIGSTSSAIEQHWDLLHQPLAAAGTSQTFSISRGYLPGGTSAYFDPAPTSTFEVAGYVSGATGTASWNVQLVSAGQVIATAVFGASDSSYVVRFGSLSWPAADAPLDSIVLTPSLGSNPASVAGTLLVSHAYVGTRQEGVVKNTSARISIAGTAAVTQTTWQDVTNGGSFTYHRADYDLPPWMLVRATVSFPDPVATMGSWRGNLRIVDEHSVQYAYMTVAPSPSQFYSGFQPVDGHTYHLQAQVWYAGTSFQVVDADVVVQQQNSATNGLVKAVGFYQAIGYAVPAAANGPQLGGEFRAPDNSGLARAERLIASASADVSAFDYTTNTELAVAHIASGQANVEVPVASPPAAADLVDVRPTASGTGTDSFVTLQDIVTLRPQVTTPVISAPAWDTYLNSGAAIAVSGSAQSGATVKVYEGSTLLGSTTAATGGSWSMTRAYAEGPHLVHATATDSSGNVSADSSPTTFTVDTASPAVPVIAAPAAGAAIRSPFLFSGTAEPWATVKLRETSVIATIQANYAGAWSTSLVLADGSHAVTAAATDRAGNSSAQSTAVNFTVDSVVPSCTGAGFTASFLAFSPNGDGTQDTTSLDCALSEPASWTVKLGPAASPVRTYSGSGSTVGVEWDGFDGASAVVPNGTYRATLIATDAAGNQMSLVGPLLKIDTVAPTCSLAVSPAAFSPNGDGVQDSTTFHCAPSETTASWSLNIAVSSRVYSGNGTFASQAWDGHLWNDAMMEDCTCAATLSLVDGAGNTGTAYSPQFYLDTKDPVVTDMTPQDGQNTIFAEQPLQARIRDFPGSGVDASSVSFVLRNEAGNTSQTVPAVFDASTGLATSVTSPQLEDYQDYGLSVSVTDAAGNGATASTLDYRGPDSAYSGGFRKIPIDAAQASVTMPSTPCSVVGAAGARVAVCEHVPLQFASTSVFVGSSRHSFDRAYLLHTVGLESATLTWNTANLSINAYDNRDLSTVSSSQSSSSNASSAIAAGIPADNFWGAREQEYSYYVGDRRSLSGTFSVDPLDATADIGTLRIVLPAQWALADNVSLSMDASTSVVDSETGLPVTSACATPLESAVPCTTDPLWSWFTVSLDGNIADRQAVFAAHRTLGADISFTYDTTDLAMYEAVLTPEIRSTIATASGVVGVHTARTKNLDKRYQSLLDEQPSAAPVLSGNALVWAPSDNVTSTTLALDPTVFSQYAVTQPFDTGDPALPGDTDASATPTTDVLQIKPAATSGLESDTAQGATERGRVRYAGPAGRYSIEAQAVTDKGLRFLVELADDSAPSEYNFDLSLPAGTHLAQTGGDSAMVFRDSSSPTDAPVGMILPPFAYDANGVKVPVRQYITATTIRLVLDLSNPAIVYPVLADPTWAVISCQPTELDGSTHDYFHVGFSYGPRHAAHCPYGTTFVQASNSKGNPTYFPISAYLCSKCTERAINPVGDSCSHSPDYGAYFDFDAPCRMHDYGYDIIKIKRPWNYGGVTKSEVDDEFKDAMYESCTEYAFWERLGCENLADHYRFFVGFASANPETRPENGWNDCAPPPSPDAAGCGSTSFLQNTDFKKGMANWATYAPSGVSVSAKVYNDGTDNFLAFTCKQGPNCAAYQDQNLRLYGGEQLDAQLWARCKTLGTSHPTSCPFVLMVYGHSTANGDWVLLDSTTGSAPTPDGYGGNAVVGVTINVMTGQTPGALYDRVRWRVKNSSEDNRLGFFRPWLILDHP
jgi:hypothetical protein